MASGEIPERPRPLRVNLEGIPQELRDIPQWVLWRYHWTGKAWTKQPLAVDGGAGSSTDPATWSTFSRALDAYLDERADGIGIVVTENDPIFAVDVDDATLEAAGPLLFDTYTEWSPSGTGFRQFAFGHKPEGARSKANNPAPGVKAIELYDRWRYLTVTGHRVEGAPASVAGNLQPEIEALVARLWPAQEVSAASDIPGAGATAPGPGTLSDRELVERILASKRGREFEALYVHGETGGDHSSADLSLCNALAFWTGRDAGAIDRIFRTSALMRPKWDQKRGACTYGELTIDRAIADCLETYTPPESVEHPGLIVKPGLVGNLAIASLEYARANGIETGIPDDVELPGREPRRGLQWLTPRELGDLRPPDWLVKGRIVADSLAMVFGPAGSGKTFHVLDLALSVAAGREFHGLPVKTSPVCYVAGEGRAGIAKRVAAWCKKHGVDRDSLPFYTSSQSVPFLDPAAVDEVSTTLHDLPAPPGLLVVDTVARNFGGGDENSTQDMSAFVDALDRIRVETGACVLAVHHSGKGEAKAARGNSALRAAIDTEFAVVEVEDGCRVSCTKQKDAEQGDPQEYTLERVSLGEVEGEEVASLVPVLREEQTAAAFAGMLEAQEKRLTYHRRTALAKLSAMAKAELLRAPGAARVYLDAADFRRALREECGLARQRVGELVNWLAGDAGIARLTNDGRVEVVPEAVAALEGGEE